ncbi:hypothetical protein K435DRAFT_804252 [Dendrothele bispora CBS 962.96]|uniref:Uncharacterized protein n=1 Tax=Dendrothele bispora (strain CBS 962.96) TaxID=1314807 RepID=A0A4S8LFF5_DENBC|nr:hypothetical protein K435DRAFT_804252 [Dendrothele bispora CBS 962.96]
MNPFYYLPPTALTAAVLGAGAGAGTAAYAPHQAGQEGGGSDGGRAPSLVLTVVCSIFEWTWWVDDAWEIGEGKRSLWTESNNGSEKEERSVVSFGPGPVSVGGGKRGLAQRRSRVSGSEGDRSGSGIRFLIWTRKEDNEDMRGDRVRKSRRIYLAGGPGAQQRASGGKPAPRDNSNPSGVLLHRDEGRIPKPQQP